MRWEALTKLQDFLDGNTPFGNEELKELTFLICARQKEAGKLAIWIDADEDVNPVSIEIFDDEYGTLSAEGIESEMIELFSQESDQVSQEFVQFSDDDGLAQYEVYFPIEDADPDSWLKEISRVVKPALLGYESSNKFEKNLRDFCLKGIA